MLLPVIIGAFSLSMASASLFFENFDDKNGMTLSHGFAAQAAGDYFGLTGGASIDFGGSTLARPKTYTGEKAG